MSVGTAAAHASRSAVRTPAWWRGAAGVACWASLSVVVVLWISHGGIQSLADSPAEALTSTGRLTGLVASDLMLVQVLLLARIPLVERSYGQDELARRHRLVGFWSFNLMLGHIALVTTGYALAARQNVLAQLWDLVVTYPGMLLATAGAAFLVLVVVTSVRAARRRLRYESWHLLHLYAYLGVGLALPHQLWTGGDFVATPLARLYWWSLWAAAALAIVTFRIGMPLWRTIHHRVVVDRVVEEGPGVVSVHMSGRHLDRLRGRAGQFFVWRFLDGRVGWTRGHPWSLSAPIVDGRLRVTVKDLGDGSALVGTLRPGTRVAVEGPYGRLTSDARTRSRLVLIGAGVGIAPLRALAEELDYRPSEAVLLHRARDLDDALLASELESIAYRRGLRIVALLGPRPAGRPSWLPASWAAVPDAEALHLLAPDLLDADIYVCGPDEWMTAVITAARSAGVAPEQLHIERFTW